MVAFVSGTWGERTPSNRLQLRMWPATAGDGLKMAKLRRKHGRKALNYATIIELDDGKIYRKALYLMVKTMVSCRVSLKSIQWNYAHVNVWNHPVWSNVVSKFRPWFCHWIMTLPCDRRLFDADMTMIMYWSQSLSPGLSFFFWLQPSCFFILPDCNDYSRIVGKDGNRL